MCRIVLHSAACCAALPFGTYLLSIKCAFGFCVQFCVKYFLFWKNHNSKQIFMQIILFLSQNLFILEFLDRCWLSWNTKFVFFETQFLQPDRQTDGLSDRHTQRSQQSLFVIVPVPLKTDKMNALPWNGFSIVWTRKHEPRTANNGIWLALPTYWQCCRL